MNLKHWGFSDFLEEDEKVFAVFRHPLGTTFLKMFFFAIIWGIISYIVWFYWENYYYDYSVENKYNYFWLIPFFIGLFKVFTIFMHWYSNSILMTNESLVFVVFNNFFDKRASRIDYFDLDDVEIEKKGVGDYLGDKGDLIFTKVSGGQKEFLRVRNPRKIIRKIREHKAKMLAEKNFVEESALKDLLSQLVQTHVRGKGQPNREKFRENISEREETSIKQDSYKSVEDDFNEEEIIEIGIEPEELKAEYKQKPVSAKFSINPLKWGIVRHFRNELNTSEEIIYEENIEIEKELDDEGGLEIDL